MVEVDREIWESVARWLELTGLTKTLWRLRRQSPSAGPSARGTRGTSPRRWRGYAQTASWKRPRWRHALPLPHREGLRPPSPARLQRRGSGVRRFCLEAPEARRRVGL